MVYISLWGIVSQIFFQPFIIACLILVLGQLSTFTYPILRQGTKFLFLVTQCLHLILLVAISIASDFYSLLEFMGHWGL